MYYIVFTDVSKELSLPVTRPTVINLVIIVLGAINCP